jgi:hypothetical protein
LQIETYSAKITAEIEAGLSDAENGSASSTIDLTNIDHIEQGDVSKAMFIKAIGGIVFQHQILVNMQKVILHG